MVHYGLQEAQEQVQACHYRSDELFDELCQWHEQHPEANGRVLAPNTFRNELSPALKDLAKTIKAVAEDIDDPSDRQDLTATHNRLVALASELKQWIKQLIPQAVYWVQVSTRRHGNPRVALAAAPIDIGPVLREHLFDSVPTAILTSATLAVGRPPSFTFFRSRIGLTHASDLRLGSPFDYQTQAQLVLVDGMPDPSAQRNDFERQCAQDDLPVCGTHRRPRFCALHQLCTDAADGVPVDDLADAAEPGASTVKRKGCRAA